MKDLFGNDPTDFETFKREATTEHHATKYGKYTDMERTMHFQAVTWKEKKRRYVHLDCFKLTTAELLKRAFKKFMEGDPNTTNEEGKERA